MHVQRRVNRLTMLVAAITCVPAATACGSGGDAVDVPAAAVESTAPSTTPATEPVESTTTVRATTTVPPTTTPAPTTTTEPPPVTTAPRELVLLRNGDEGPRVARFQRGLATLGYLPAGSDDGVFDRETSQAVIDFQSEYGLVVDGIVGPQTERAIFAAATSTSPDG